MPIRAFGRWTGATPLFESLVRAWHRVGFHTHPAAPRGVAPVRSIPAGRQWSQLIGRRYGQRSRAAEKRQTTTRPPGTTCTPGWCAQPKIFASQHTQLATPLDSPGRRDSRVDTRLTCPRSNCSVKPWKNGRSASSPKRSRHIASVSPLSHQRGGWPPRDRPAESARQPRNPSTRLANRPYRSDTTGLISALCPQSRWRWKGDASSVARSA